MAHWAELNDDNVVIRVVVTNNDDLNGDEGYQWLIDNLGGRWIKTSYNGTIRKNFAGVDFIYDELRDAFIAPKPFNSWLLNEDTCCWEAPKPKPDGLYVWDESKLDWIELNV